MWFIKTKKKREVELEKAREMFFSVQGSHFGIARDFGVAYWKYKITKEIEVSWKTEIEKKSLKI